MNRKWRDDPVVANAPIQYRRFLDKGNQLRALAAAIKTEDGAIAVGFAFWKPTDKFDRNIMRSFADGRARAAYAEYRKILTQGGETVTVPVKLGYLSAMYDLESWQMMLSRVKLCQDHNWAIRVEVKWLNS